MSPVPSAALPFAGAPSHVLPELMRGPLMNKLRAARPDGTAQLMGQRIQYGPVAPMVTRHFACSRNRSTPLIDERRVSGHAPAKCAVIGEWFATVAESCAAGGRTVRFVEMHDAIS